MIFEKGQKYTENFVVTEETYKTFQECSHDKNPLHTNEKFAQTKGFKSVVMYGNILNAFLSYFVGECLPIKDVMLQSQNINYKRPVYMNDKLCLDVEVEDIFESVNAVVFKYKISNQDNKIVANGKIQIGTLL